MYYDYYILEFRMISSYRLGDLVCLTLGKEEEQLMLDENPNTIGSEYILQRRISPNMSKMSIIIDILRNTIKKYVHLLPSDIQTSTLIHVRLGDVVCGNFGHERGKRPLNISELQQKVPPSDKIYVIGKCFFAPPSSTNYDECISSSNDYLQNVLNTLNAEHFDGGHADIDLCCGIVCKTFIQGRGYFSKLIVDIRKFVNAKCIETQPETSI